MPAAVKFEVLVLLAFYFFIKTEFVYSDVTVAFLYCTVFKLIVCIYNVHMYRVYYMQSTHKTIR